MNRAVNIWTVVILLLPVAAAQLDYTGGNICRLPNTRGYRCCDGFYPVDSQCSVCDTGWYGPECTKRCECYNSAACNHVTGACACNGFWGGPHCTECKMEFYHAYCHERCTHCFNGDSCDPNQNECQCAAGYTGPYCDEPCLDDDYGNNCKNVCNPGWEGLKCRDPCPDGYYGDKCAEMCPECQYGKCDHIKGCVCEPGYAGDRCSSLCPVGSYGPNCLYKCNCKNGATCDPVSGNCTCISNYYGSGCLHNLENYVAPTHVSGLRITVYVLVAAVNIALLAALVLYRSEVRLRAVSIMSRLKTMYPTADEEQIEFDGVGDMKSRHVKEYHDDFNEDVEEDEFGEPGEFTRFKVN